MDTAPQDRCYLEREADDFFERNFRDADPHTLRDHKRSILTALDEAGVREPRRVLEYGCGYGDLLRHLAREHAAECVGIEPSARAVAFGTEAYGDAITLYRGTMADNPVARDPESVGRFDLVIVEDVLCWVSRETLLRSLAHLDDALGDGGFLFLREFLPRENRKNPNHHVEGEEVFCFKPAGPHHRVLTATGMYEIVWQKVWIDADDPWVRDAARDPFESRWSDAVLRKSTRGYYR